MGKRRKHRMKTLSFAEKQKVSSENLDRKGRKKFWDLDSVLLGMSSSKEKSRTLKKLRQRTLKAEPQSDVVGAAQFDWINVTSRSKRRLKKRRKSAVVNSSETDVTNITDQKLEVNADKLNIFFQQYFTAIDSQRNILINAYKDNAKLEIISNIPTINNGTFEGVKNIAEFLHILPATKHISEKCALNLEKVTAQEGCAEIKGQVHLDGYNIISFKRKMIIVPHNNGLSCISDILELS